MTPYKRRSNRGGWNRATWLALVALASLSFWVGCGDEPEREEQPADGSQTDVPRLSMLPPLGQIGLNERVFDATVIARATLISTNATAENIGTDSNGATVYRGLLEFKFNVLEYLKGTGGGELVVFVTDQLDRTYATMELALEAAQSWKRDRDTRWDNREALIFAEEPVGSSGQVTRYSFGPYGYIEAYTLDSGNRVWLPSAMSGGTGSASPGDLRFLLEEPGGGGSSGGTSGSGQPETVSVSEMKTVIAKLEKWQKDGEGVEGYLECIRTSFYVESRINGYKERGESLSSTYDFYLDSGLPARTVIEDGHPANGSIGRVWIEGRDEALFSYGDGALRTMRPLPTGKYFVHPNYQASRLIPCGYYPAEYKNMATWFVNVTAPVGTLHEAFFDPVTLRQAQGRPAPVGADATNGVLKPASFTDGNNASATLQRIAYESPSTGSEQAGAVKLKLSPHTGLANHVVDFIGLDGSVILSLDADDATVDAANNTLSWPVSHQPWKDGDKLMLRIRMRTT